MPDQALPILERLVGFQSVSGRPTHEIVGYIKDYLQQYGLEVSLSYDDAGERANVFATIGPEIDGGVVLNGHTDVVTVEGQNWATDPFTLTRRQDRFYGRGAVDMKGFLACAMASVPMFQAAGLRRPVHLAFSYDEETGGFGMPVLLEDMAGKAFRPEIVIVGEPTEMAIVTGHKGGDEMRTEITGHEVHSCDPTRGVSAISAAMRLIAKIEEIGAQLAANAYSELTLRAHLMQPSMSAPSKAWCCAETPQPGWCYFDWEFRPDAG